MADFFEMIKKVEKDLFDKIYRNVDKEINILRADIKKEMALGMKKARHYDSLCRGKLAEDFGFDKGRGFEFADSVIEAVVEALQINPSKTSNDITINIAAYREDMTDALSAKRASYPSKGGNVDWLVWLLLKGNDVILQNWGVLKKNINSSKSRSGAAIMAPVPSPLKISFAVRGDFAGTRNNNWITESAKISKDSIIGHIKQFMERCLRL